MDVRGRVVAANAGTAGGCRITVDGHGIRRRAQLVDPRAAGRAQYRHRGAVRDLDGARGQGGAVRVLLPDIDVGGERLQVRDHRTGLPDDRELPVVLGVGVGVGSYRKPGHLPLALLQTPANGLYTVGVLAWDNFAATVSTTARRLDGASHRVDQQWHRHQRRPGAADVDEDQFRLADDDLGVQRDDDGLGRGDHHGARRHRRPSRLALRDAGRAELAGPHHRDEQGRAGAQLQPGDAQRGQRLDGDRRGARCGDLACVPAVA